MEYAPSLLCRGDGIRTHINTALETVASPSDHTPMMCLPNHCNRRKSPCQHFSQSIFKGGSSLHRRLLTGFPLGNLPQVFLKNKVENNNSGNTQISQARDGVNQHQRDAHQGKGK